MNARNDQADPLLPEERDLAERLLRLGPHDGPSPALDAKILAAAHAAVAAEPRPRSQRRWPVWIGMAASLCLAVGIAWQMRPVDQAPAPYQEDVAYVTSDAAADVAASAGAADSAAAGAGEPYDAAAPVTIAEPAAATASAAAAASDHAAAGPIIIAKKAEPAHAPSPAAASSAVAAAAPSEPEHRDSAKYLSAPRPEAPPAPPPPQAVAPVANVAPTPAPIAPEIARAQVSGEAAARQNKQALSQAEDIASSPAPTVAPYGGGTSTLSPAPQAAPQAFRRSEASKTAESAGREREAATSSQPAMRAQRSAVANAAETSPFDAGAADQRLAAQGDASAYGPVAGDKRLGRSEWLQRIRDRSAQGDLASARESLALFRSAHPREPIPDDLRSLFPAP